MSENVVSICKIFSYCLWVGQVAGEPKTGRPRPITSFGAATGSGHLLQRCLLCVTRDHQRNIIPVASRLLVLLSRVACPNAAPRVKCLSDR